MKVQGQVAIVTGGASGIGAALVAALVRRQCRVTLVDIDAEGAKATAQRLSAVGPGRVTASIVDVCDREGMAEVVRATADDHGRLDLLFNNAGIGAGGATEELLPEHWRRVIDVNLLGVVNGIAAAYPLMLEQGQGHIVNTASMAGLVPSPGFGPYASTKSAIVGLSLALRLEAAERGVRVSVVCPGVVDTPMLDRKHPDGLPLTPSQSRTDVRAFSTHMGGSPYPPQRLANDVLRGVESNRAVIVAPAAARAVWRLYRLFPGAVFLLGRRTFERERRLWGWVQPASHPTTRT